LPPVSIVVPAWNELGMIEQCVMSLQQLNYPAWEAIIMAGGKDGTYEATLKATAGDDRFRVLERGSEPKNVVLTRGIEAAGHDILALLDADSIVDAEWLKELVASLTTGTAATYGFYLPSKWTWVSIEEYMVQVQYHINKVAVFPGCASVAIRRDALQKAGSLTADAYSWEDWDVYARLVDAHQRIVPVPQAKLLSERPATFREFWANNLRAFRTHLAGLWYHRNIAVRRPLWAIHEIFFLAYGSALSLAGLGALAVVAVRPAWLPTVAKGAALLALWIFGRRAALAAEVAAYTGQGKWLAWSWTLVVLLFVRILATLFSILTVRRQPTFDYKGARVQQAEQVTSNERVSK
jgi:cellulose synthase/poly-beta-1,6-N-acetylglucosamine synthase-like glycosyltransferase